MTSYWAVCRVESGDVVRFMKNPGPSIRGALGLCLMEESKDRGVDYVKLIFKPDRRILGRKLMLRKLKHPPTPFIIPPPRIVGRGLVEIGLSFYGKVGLDIDFVISLLKKFEKRRFTGDLKLVVEEIRNVNDLKGETMRIYSNGKVEGAHTLFVTLEDVERWVDKVVEKELDELKIMFLTPFRLVKDGKTVTSEDLRPSDLVRYILRRYFLLEYLYNRRRLPWLSPHYVDELKDWVDKNIFIDKKLKESEVKVKGMGGFMEGYLELVFKEDSRMRDMVRCLKIGELIAMGKNTSYGYGHYRLII